MKQLEDSSIADASLRTRLETSSWFAVVHAYLACTQQYGRMLHQLGLTIPQFDALTAIHTLGIEASPSAVADRLLVSRANISGVMKRLREQGWIDVKQHETDGRSTLCSLTPEGERVRQSAQAAAARFVSAQLAPFSDEDLNRVKVLMQQMHSHLNAMDPITLAHGPLGPSSEA